MSKNMPGRLLRLLSLLQSRREWSGDELAERLGVTDRTVRRDIDRLRALDYPVESTTGTAGGYRLVSGANLPPLQLDDDEAIAVATGLVAAAGGNVAGVEEASVRALAKLEQVLPARLRPRLAALARAIAAVPHSPVPDRDAPRVDPALLVVLASCCRDQELLSFDYGNQAGETSLRRVEPHNLVTVKGFWYLLAYDPHREDWRTFRVDRIDNASPTHRRFTPRDLPAADAATYLARTFAGATYRYTATIIVGLAADAVRARLIAPVRGDIEDRGPGECAVRVSADSPELVTQYVAAVAALGAGFSLDAPEEIRQRVRSLGQQLGSGGSGAAVARPTSEEHRKRS